jgi:hypothetical protein
MYSSQRDSAIVAWHEVPGELRPKRARPVGYGMSIAGVRTSIRRLQYWNDEVSGCENRRNLWVQKGSVTSKSSPNIRTKPAFYEDLRN